MGADRRRHPVVTDPLGALRPVQVEVVRLFFSLPASAGFLLAGGAALIAQGLSARPTQDVDVFTSPGAGDVTTAREQFVAAAAARGWTVEEIETSDTFCRLVVLAGEQMLMDLGLDSPPQLPATMTVLGPSMSAAELAGRKTLALFDRAAARDFVDVYHLAEHFDRDALLERAAALDLGFDFDMFAEQLRRLDRYRDEDLPIEGQGVPSLRRFFADWLRELST